MKSFVLEFLDRIDYCPEMRKSTSRSTSKSSSLKEKKKEEKAYRRERKLSSVYFLLVVF